MNNNTNNTTENTTMNSTHDERTFTTNTETDFINAAIMKSGRNDISDILHAMRVLNCETCDRGLMHSSVSICAAGHFERIAKRKAARTADAAYTADIKAADEEYRISTCAATDAFNAAQNAAHFARDKARNKAHEARRIAVEAANKASDIRNNI